MEIKFLISFLFLFFLQQKHSPVTIEGTVLSDRTERPVANAFVYTVEGEEEALTDSKGRFKIVTWQKFPLLLTVKHKDHQLFKIKLAETSGPQIIRLKGP